MPTPAYAVGGRQAMRQAGCSAMARIEALRSVQSRVVQGLWCVMAIASQNVEPVGEKTLTAGVAC